MANDPSQIAGRLLLKALDIDRRAKKRFNKEGKEIAQYGFSPDHGFQYQTLPKSSFFQAKVALTAQFIKVVGPHLFQNVPHRTINARPWASQEQLERSKLVSDYLNYSIGEYGFYDNQRRSIDESMSWGRGVSWTERSREHPELIKTTYGSVRDLYVDGEMSALDKKRRVTRRCVEPRSEVIAKWPEAEAQIRKMPKATKRFDQETELPGETASVLGDSVCYYETWTKSPLWHMEGGREYEEALKTTGVETAEFKPTHYVFTEDNTVIWEGPWEVPFYMDDEFPCTPLDFYDYPDSQWPAAPLSDALGYQKAINWVVTLMMGKYRFTSRTIMALARQNEQGLEDIDQSKVLVGGDVEAVSLKVNGETKKLGDFIMQFDWNNDWLNASIKFMEVMQREFEKASGLYSILYSGETGTQIRSATDAQVKDRNSRGRIDDMRERVIRWQSKIARKEALAARFLLEEGDIEKTLGPDAAKNWGFLVKPGADTLQAWMQQMVSQGVPPDEAAAMAQEKAAQSVDLERWSREVDYEIISDSIVKPDVDAQINAFKEMSNQTLPTLLQSPNPLLQSLALSMNAEYFQKIGMAPKMVNDLRQAAQIIMSTPPPAQQPQEPA